MSVVTAMEEAGPHRVKLTIEVPAPAVEAEIGRVLDELRRNVRIPGFRKGKVPPKMLRRRFKQDIEREVTERLVPRYWQQAQAEKDIDALLPPTLEDVQMAEGEAMTLVAAVETRPEIVLDDVESFDLPEDTTEPTDAEVQDAVTDLRKSFAEWKTVDREAAQGDLVVGTMLDLDGHGEGDDGEEDEDGGEEAATEPRPLHFEIGAAGSDEELSLLLTGKGAGATVIYEQKHGEGDDAETHRFEITIGEVREQELPELDGDLAEKLGFEQPEEISDALRKRLQNEKAEALRRARTEALLHQLRERHPLPSLPEGVVQQEAETLMREQVEHLARQGVDLEAVDLDLDQMLDRIRPAAEKRVHERLVLDAIAKDKDLRLDEEKFEQFLTMAAAQQQVSSLALRQRLAEDGRLDPLRAQLLRDQTLGQLLGDEPDGVEDSEAEEAAEEES